MLAVDMISRDTARMVTHAEEVAWLYKTVKLAFPGLADHSIQLCGSRGRKLGSSARIRYVRRCRDGTNYLSRGSPC